MTENSRPEFSAHFVIGGPGLKSLGLHYYAVRMSWLLVMAAIGVYLTDGGFRQSEAKPFIYPVKRAQLMSKGNAYRMLGISGVIITVLGIIFHFTRG